MSKPADDNLRADLSAYLDDELSPERRAAVAAWLAASPEAQAELRALRCVKTQVATLPRAAAPAALAQAVLAEAAERLPALVPAPGDHRRRPHRRWVRLTLRISSAAAVLMLGAFLGAYWQARLQYGFSGPLAATHERVANLAASRQPPGTPAPPANQGAALSAAQGESLRAARPQEAARQLAAAAEPTALERNEKAVVPARGTTDFFSSAARDARLEQLTADASDATSGAGGGAGLAGGTRVADTVVAPPQPETGVPDTTEPGTALHRARGQAPTPGRTDALEIPASGALPGSTGGFHAYHGGAAPPPQVAIVVPTTSIERYAATADALSQWAFAPSADLDHMASVATAAGVLRVNLAVPRSEVGERLGRLMALNAGAPLRISTHFAADDSVLAWDVAAALTQSTRSKTDADGHDRSPPARERATALTAPLPRAPSVRVDAGRTAPPATSEGVDVAARSIREAAPHGATGAPLEPGAEQRPVASTPTPPPSARDKRPAANTRAGGPPALAAPQAGPPAPSSQPALVQMEVILVPPPLPATAPASAPAPSPQ